MLFVLKVWLKFLLFLVLCCYRNKTKALFILYATPKECIYPLSEPRSGQLFPGLLFHQGRTERPASWHPKTQILLKEIPGLRYSSPVPLGQSHYGSSTAAGMTNLSCVWCIRFCCQPNLYQIAEGASIAYGGTRCKRAPDAWELSNWLAPTPLPAEKESLARRRHSRDEDPSFVCPHQSPSFYSLFLYPNSDFQAFLARASEAFRSLAVRPNPLSLSSWRRECRRKDPSNLLTPEKPLFSISFRRSPL